jgi:predicted RNase H-like HicB family nuclease
MTIEEAPSWPDCLAAKETYEEAVELYGAQSAEASEASVEYLRLEGVCQLEAGITPAF